ncbi:hypothetical protein HBI56_128850 [Parastagonospora nodorum]|nr:hypothetical protein HBH56_155040 [Parastagonospora nodorum]KAH3926805.1 hypothetical protein HBH54_162650 [Parastagonospora nodorum]KAH3943235.1 hypothetical protein HBH53_176510 [Parastagonospora nodorum]KAH3970177.1 hypothetical protein HBH52_168220 [Parastagonospora nodorum]KAH3972095.1 hypothetical protein HBH51_104990 [Parastagonospora nodorum]
MSHTVGKPDPFGQRRRLAHSAISDEYRLTPETYENLFGEVFFESQIYRVWSQGNRPWALHCYGDPGCGKTTLAAITVNRLRAHGTSSVVSVFIGKDTKVSAADLLEDLLVCIHNQLRSIDPETDNHFAQYETACRYGESVSRRTTLLRVAITSLLDKHQHTFLVIDGYDRVGHDLQILLDRELADLRAHRLRVMLTRRVPAFEPPRVKICDGCQAYNLKLYWSCKACFALQLPFDLCYDCRVKERICVVHGVAHFEESYNHVSTDVSYPDNMEEYLLWELRRMSRVPQLHMFLEDAGMSQRIIKSMSYDRNITIAKLYLDNVFREQCLDVVVKVNDRLPRNIIAMFDDGIGRIKQRPDREADIGLLAIAAVGENNQGIALVSLANWMRDALSRLPYLAQAPPRSLEDILRYTNGFIQERVSNSGDRYFIVLGQEPAQYIPNFQDVDGNLSNSAKIDISAVGFITTDHR